MVPVAALCACADGVVHLVERASVPPPGPVPLSRLVGVVPAAGGASRLQPLAGSKEVLPVGGRPVMDHLIERMRVAECAEIRVVTRPEKRDVQARAAELGAAVVLGRPASVSESLLLGIEGLHPGDVAILGFPDTLWEPRDGFVRIVGALDPDIDVVLGVFGSPEPGRSDVVELGADGHVVAVSVKPAEPRSELVWGIAAARVAALGGLADVSEPGHLFDALAHAGKVAGVQLRGEMLDIGTRAALEGVLARFR